MVELGFFPNSRYWCWSMWSLPVLVRTLMEKPWGQSLKTFLFLLSCLNKKDCICIFWILKISHQKWEATPDSVILNLYLDLVYHYYHCCINLLQDSAAHVRDEAATSIYEFSKAFVKPCTGKLFCFTKIFSRSLISVIRNWWGSL